MAARARSVRARTGATIVAAFAAAIVVLNVPSWRGDAAKDLDSVVRDPLEQRWNLFAPDPPSANLSTFLLTDDGQDVAGPFDLSSRVREHAREHRIRASKLVRVVTKLNVALEAQAYADARAGVVRTTDARSTLIEEYRRMLSGAVAARGDVRWVRGIVVRTPVRSFARRGATITPGTPVVADPQEAPPAISPDVIADLERDVGARPILIFDSGWLLFADDVAPMGIGL